MPDKHVSVAIEPQHKTLSLGIRSGSESVALGMDPLPVRTTRHAETAKRLETPRRIAVVGDVSGDTLFDGSEDVAIGTAVEVMTTMEIDALLESAMAIGG